MIIYCYTYLRSTFRIHHDVATNKSSTPVIKILFTSLLIDYLILYCFFYSKTH